MVMLYLLRVFNRHARLDELPEQSEEHHRRDEGQHVASGARSEHCFWKRQP